MIISKGIQKIFLGIVDVNVLLAGPSSDHK